MRWHTPRRNGRSSPRIPASLADALATVTVLLTRPAGRRPADRVLRAALYGHAFNPQRRSLITGPAASALAWLERASLPVSQLSDPQVIRAALDGLCVRLDGSPAAAATISRKRAVFHNALGYAVELGLLPANPVSQVQWRAPAAATAIHPAAVASPLQVRAILAQVAAARPELAAFFGCLYDAALRPEEAVVLRGHDLILPADGRGKMILTAACPRTGAAWTSTGAPHEPRGLKHRPADTIRVVPIPPVLVRMLCRHLRQFGTAPDGRLFRGARGGITQPSTVTASLEHAIAEPGNDRWPFDLARIQLTHGSHLRRSERTADARRHLAGAAKIFHRLGATPWAARPSEAARAGYGMS